MCSLTVGWSGYAKREGEAIFALMDMDDSGTVEFDEFVTFVQWNPTFFGPLVAVERLFSAYDANQDGFLEAEELLTLVLEVEMEALGDEMPDITKVQQIAAEMMSRYDQNKDEKLSLAEFAQASCHPPALAPTPP